MLCLFLFGCLRSYGWAANVKNAQFGHNLSTVVIKTNSSNHISTCQIVFLLHSREGPFFELDWANLLYSDADERPAAGCNRPQFLQSPSNFPPWIDFLRTEDGFLSAGSMDFPRPLNRFLGIGSNFSHSRVAVTRVGFNIQPGGHFKEWHCTITAWFILIRRLGFRWIRFKRNVFFSQGNDLAG